MTNQQLPPLPKHDHAFQDPEDESPDILVWNEASMRAYALAAIAGSAHESRADVCAEIAEILRDQYESLDMDRRRALADRLSP